MIPQYDSPHWPHTHWFELAMTGLLLLLLGLIPSAPTYAPALYEYAPPSLCIVADSVFAQSDTAQLRRLIDSAKRRHNRRNPDVAAHAAMAALHFGELAGDQSLFGEAFDRLDDVESIYKEDACFFYYRGVIRRELGTRFLFAAEVFERIVNRDNVELAVRDFRHSAELEPGWLDPAAALAALSIEAIEGRPGRRARWQSWARSALGAYAETGGTEPDLYLWRGRLLMQVDSFQSALLAFDRYTGSFGLGDLETAAALFALDRANEGAEAYWAGLASLSDGAVVTELWGDLYYIFDPKEAAEWARLRTAGARARWVRRFWERRAARDLVSLPEILSEHYARLRFARAHYRLASQARPYSLADRVNARRDAEPLDDRGLVYIREGEPENVVRCLGPTLFESWVYTGVDRAPTLVHFTPGGQVDDWNLVGVIPASCIARLGFVDPRYNYLAWKMSHSNLDRAEYRMRERNRTELVAQRVLTSDRYRLPLDGQLEFGYEWLFFRGSEPGSVDATLSYAVPVEQLGCERSGGLGLCGLAVRASIFSPDKVLDRLAVSEEVLLSPDHGDWILGHFSGAAVSGTWDYRVAVFESPDSASDRTLRGNRASGQFTIPPFDGADPTRMSVSSLVLARAGEGEWLRGGQALALNPLHVYPPGGSVDLYYEIYGLPEEDSYTTELILLEAADPPTLSLDPPAEWISDLLRKKRSSVRLRFEESGARDGRPWIERRTTLSFTGVRPGKYVVVLAITPFDQGTTVYRVTPLRIGRSAR